MRGFGDGRPARPAYLRRRWTGRCAPPASGGGEPKAPDLLAW